MKSLFDAAAAVLAPHLCVACGAEGESLCDTCILAAGESMVPRCAGCQKLSKDYRTCHSCRSWLRVSRIYIATPYEAVYEKLLRSYKFDFQRSAARQIAQTMYSSIQSLPAVEIVCPVPTAPSRVRERGFDHAKLIAQEFYRLLPNNNKPRLAYPVSRRGNSRQLGASRTQRIDQMQTAFYVAKPSHIKGRSVLIVDDVVTTGATLAAVAKALKVAGAKHVYAVVYARKV